MKSTLFFTFIAAAAFFISSCGSGTDNSNNNESTAETGTENTYSLDASQSSIVWDGTMLGVYTHTGTINVSNGLLMVSNGQLKGADVTVDMNSITPTDENYNPEEGKTKDKLVGHLSSPDFFDVESSPTANFKVSSVEGNTATGTLTVRGVSNEEKLTDIVISENEGIVTATGKLTFDRKKYNVAWDSPMKEMVLSNDINLNISLSGTAQ